MIHLSQGNISHIKMLINVKLNYTSVIKFTAYTQNLDNSILFYLSKMVCRVPHKETQ